MSKSTPTEIQLSMSELVKFVRQLAHDLRNHLNAAELQSAYLLEIAENNEVREEIEKDLKSQEQARLEKQWIDRLKKKTFFRYF